MRHVNLSMRSDKNFFSLEVNDTGEPKVTTIKMKHGESFLILVLKKNRTVRGVCSICWICY